MNIGGYKAKVEYRRVRNFSIYIQALLSFHAVLKSNDQIYQI